MSNINYRNQISSQIRRDINKAQEVNKDYQYLKNNQFIGNEWAKRQAQTANTPAENEEFFRQVINNENRALRQEDKRQPYRLQGMN